MNLLDHINNLNWPKLDSKLFSANEPWNWLNASIDFVGKEEKFYIYASGYRVAAEILFQNLDSKTREHDVLIYPIVFLMRQGIELLLKDIIITSYKILGFKQGFPKHHSLVKLWNEVKSVQKKMHIKVDKKEIQAIDYLMNEFELIDPFSSAFRYPVDHKEDESLKEIRKIDLKNFMEVSNGIYNYFEGTTIQVAEYWDNIKGSV